MSLKETSPRYLSLKQILPLTGIATLGPAGTSSEQAAQYFLTRADPAPVGEISTHVHLFASYEAAALAVLTSSLSHLVVANAYSGVNTFYMDPAFKLAGVFVLDTPLYGIARVPGHVLPDKPSIATHPAPVPLVAELLPEGVKAGDIVLTSSTSTAAQQARSRATDLALTTVLAAAAHHLELISRTRTIRMLWSVFEAAAG
jgi:prephenate dehydratase